MGGVVDGGDDEDNVGDSGDGYDEGIDNDDGGNDDDGDDGLLPFIFLHWALQPHIKYSWTGWRYLGGGIGFQGIRSCRADGEASLF